MLRREAAMLRREAAQAARAQTALRGGRREAAMLRREAAQAATRREAALRGGRREAAMLRAAPPAAWRDDEQVRYTNRVRHRWALPHRGKMLPREVLN
jgi:hypothetical protein